MKYGLNNNLGNANNVNKVQNSSFVNKKTINQIKGAINIAGALDGIKYGKTGFDRILAGIGLLKGGKALMDKE